MYHSPVWFGDQAPTPLKEDLVKGSGSTLSRTSSFSIKHRVVLVEMQFTSNIIALVQQAIVPGTCKDSGSESLDKSGKN